MIIIYKKKKENIEYNIFSIFESNYEINIYLQYYSGKRSQIIYIRSMSRKSRNLDALGSKEVMVVRECERE